jgi:hypothetical protein
MNSSCMFRRVIGQRFEQRLLVITPCPILDYQRAAQTSGLILRVARPLKIGSDEPRGRSIITDCLTIDQQRRARR